MTSLQTYSEFQNTLEEIQSAGLFKKERIIESPQDTKIVVNGKTVLNLCANNYLGLANDEELKTAAIEGIKKYGLGLASVRFICGTQTIHKELEQEISNFFGTEDTILYSSCFDANGGLFETLLNEEDAIISDSLNHASIIDGIRLCKASRYRYANQNMQELEVCLKEAKAKGAKKIMIATDGVFSMDGYVANLSKICDLADEYSALVMVDECHATGFYGPTGKGSVEECNVLGRVDVITSTLGKALGGSSGGFTTGRKSLIELLRQRSRPYLFSNALAPAIVTASIACLKMIQKSTYKINKLKENTSFWRKNLKDVGFNIKEGVHPIVPVMIGDAKLASEFATKLLDHGVYAIGFSFPVVPKDQARIRTQMSAAHTKEDLEKALSAFKAVGKELSII
jgi:glycine C-acetyltransferase